MSATDMADWDATETAAAIRSGAVSALEAVDAAIARAEALDPQLNFLVTEDFERARDRARAPIGDGMFAGVPFLIKDLDDFAGLPTRSGSRATAAKAPAARIEAVARADAGDRSRPFPAAAQRPVVRVAQRPR